MIINELTFINYNEQRELALELFNDDKYTDLRAIIKTECFDKIFQYINDNNIDLTPYLDKCPEEWIYQAGCRWQGMTDIQRSARFDRLTEDEWIYHAGCKWQGVTDAQRSARFDQLTEDPYIYLAGRYWFGVTDGQRSVRFEQLTNDHHIRLASIFWSNITNEQFRP